MHKTIPTKVKEQTTLEEEALDFKLENEEKEIYSRLSRSQRTKEELIMRFSANKSTNTK